MSAAPPDVSLSFKEREPGGLGIFLMTHLADEPSYKRENGFNVMTIKKRLEGD
jgi:anti-sigma regulatory factor (Ser/Thr protein kinase)